MTRNVFPSRYMYVYSSELDLIWFNCTYYVAGGMYAPVSALVS